MFNEQVDIKIEFSSKISLMLLSFQQNTHRKSFICDLRKRFFKFISSIRSKNTFRTNKNLFDFNKSRF